MSSKRNYTQQEDETLIIRVSFMGHIISSEGLTPDPSKAAAIQGMPAPMNKDGVRRLLGTIKYLKKFAPNLSEVTAPVRELLQETSEFYWDEAVQGKCFKQVKECLLQSPVLKFFNPDEAVVLQCDPSQKGQWVMPCSL